MQAQDLIQRVAAYDKELASDLQKFVGSRRLGLVYEESKPEYVRLTNKPVIAGDLVNILPPRGVAEDLTDDSDEHDVIWRVSRIADGVASLYSVEEGATCDASVDDLVAIARFDRPICCGLTETGKLLNGAVDGPCNVVINGENFHALEALLFSYRGRVDCIYIDPPYNSGANDWKYNNNYVSGDDSYRHSKWLTFMEDRLVLAGQLLNPQKSCLICAIDEREFHRLALLLERLFPGALIQMITTVTAPKGTGKSGGFSRVEEQLYFVLIGEQVISAQEDGMIEPQFVLGEEKCVHWHGLRRREPTSVRRSRPNQFYPVFVNASTKQIVGIGDPIPPDVNRSDVDVPNGCFALWPLKPDGTEMIWALVPETFNDLLEKGYVRLSENRGSYTVQFLQSGTVADIERGLVVVERPDQDGPVEAYYSAGTSTTLPKQIWHRKSHNAETFGTKLISQLLPGRVFPYPKSLYAVEDSLRFVIGENLEAVVVDFFAGSGTTAHALMRLNHQDGGHRVSISVTNNEVSEEEATLFSTRGLRPGDSEWEERGIARYITIPRITAAITGKNSDGDSLTGKYECKEERFLLDEDAVVISKSTGKPLKRNLYAKKKVNATVRDSFPMSEGFEENAVFFDLEYLEPAVISADLAFDEIAPLLWMRSGSKGPIIHHGDTYEITDYYAVLFYSYAAPFIRECHSKDVDHIFVVTDIDANYRSMHAEFPGKDVVQLYKQYLKSFEIGVDR